MDILQSVVFAINVFSALIVVVLVLMQDGKGAEVGAVFGGGTSGSIFGAAGSANFLSHLTAIFATVFFLTSLSMAYFSASPLTQGQAEDIIERYSTKAPQSAPASTKSQQSAEKPLNKENAIPN